MCGDAQASPKCEPCDPELAVASALPHDASPPGELEANTGNPLLARMATEDHVSQYLMKYMLKGDPDKGCFANESDAWSECEEEEGDVMCGDAQAWPVLTHNNACGIAM
jgi:hypothetical protein